MPSLVCPLPGVLDYDTALKKLQEVQQRRKALSAAAQERFAARELGVDVPTFRRALKQRPSPSPAPRPVPVTPKPVLNNTTKLLSDEDMAAACKKRLDEVALRRRSLDRSAQERVAAKEMGMDVKEFRAALRGSQVELHTYTEPSFIRALKRIPDPGHTDSFYKANTYLDWGDMQTTINCARVVNAYELRRRGYDVIAKIGSAHKNPFQLNQMWRVRGKSTPPEIQFIKAGDAWYELAFKTWADDPVGARYQIVVVWPGETSSHIFSAEKLANGKIKFFDAQVHTDDAASYFDRISKKRAVYAWRVDNCEPTQEVIDLLEAL